MTTLFFAAGLAGWAGLHVVRLLFMYRLGSRWQCWRKYDVFGLVPVGAFFSPGVPPREVLFVYRALLADGTMTSWRADPRPVRRMPWHLLWNPLKQDYRSVGDVARDLLHLATVMDASDGSSSPRLQFSGPYLKLLRYAAAQADRHARAAQFAIVEVDLDSQMVMRSVLSAFHTVDP